MSRFVWFIMVAEFLVIGSVGCSRGISDDALSALPPKEAGRKVYEVKCQGRHIIDGTGGTRGPNLSNVGARMDEPTLRTFIADPRAARPGARMPKISLTDKQIEAAAAYLSGLK